MVTTRSQARLQATNRPPSVDDFQGRGSDLPIERDDGADIQNTRAITPSVGVRQKGVGQRKAVAPKKSILFSWTPDTGPRKLRRNTVGGREGERVFPTRTRASTDSSERADSIEKGNMKMTQQPTPKFGKEMTNFQRANKLRRTPPLSPKLTPQERTRSPSPTISEDIIQPIAMGGEEIKVSVPIEDNVTKEAMPEHTQEVVTGNPLWYNREGLLRAYLPISNRQGQIGRPMISKDEMQRQEWLRWISWIWEARRQNVEGQLPAIITNAKANLDPSIREYDVQLSRMIFRAIVSEAVQRMPTEEEMLNGIREGFILAMQLRDTQQMPTELQTLHRKDEDNSVTSAAKLGSGRGNVSPREFSLEQMGSKDVPAGKLLQQLKQQQTTPMPRQSKYFTPEQSENESEVGSIQRYRERLPRDIPQDSDAEIKKKPQHQEYKREWKNEINEGAVKLTKQLIDSVNVQRAEKKIKPIVNRNQDPSPSPSSSSTSADERRRRARKEKEKEKEKKKKKKVGKKRRKRKSDGDDDDPSDNSRESSSDSDVGNKKYGKGNFESSSEESEQSEKATKQQRKCRLLFSYVYFCTYFVHSGLRLWESFLRPLSSSD